MRTVRWLALTGSLMLAASVVAAAPGLAATHPAAQPARPGTLTFGQARSHPDGTVAANSQIGFDLVLSLRNAAGAATFARNVSTPGSAAFHHYLTDAQWVSRYAPTKTAAGKAESWLRREGFTAGRVPGDRLFVPAQGTAYRVERAFGIELGYYKVNGERVRLAKGPIAVPAPLAGAVSGTVGINEYLATPGLAVTGGAAPAVTARSTHEPPPPAGFRNPQPCSDYWSQKIDTADAASLYKPFTYPEPYDICGYKPTQLRGAYGLSGPVAKGDDGKGVTIAIVDAYDSPNLLANAQQYFSMNDPSHPLSSAQFTNDEPTKIDNENQCAGGNGWYAEQALDVESSHAMAPGANITFVGAKSCLNPDLLAAENTAVTSGASVVSNSWLETVGDLLDDASVHTAFDNTFLMADSTGVSVLFCTGDTGDNFADYGMAVPDYPATSPYVTAVGGTTLEVSARDNRAAEYGWSTARQILCTPATTNCGPATKPEGSLLYDDGAGGGTSYYYAQPSYQAPVVPNALALRNQALFGTTPMRVTPDISMDADPQSGMLIGLTQAFPDGNYYSQFKEGGTSLASPLLAGVIADTDQAAGGSIGFLNPELYKADKATPAAFNDILPPANPDSTAVVRVDYADAVDSAQGYVISLRAINYAGPETYCDATGNCATRDVTDTTAPGYDSLTGLGSVGSKFIATLSQF